MKVHLETMYFEQETGMDLTLRQVDIKIGPPEKVADRLRLCRDILRGKSLRLECMTVSGNHVRVMFNEEE